VKTHLLVFMDLHKFHAKYLGLVFHRGKKKWLNNNCILQNGTIQEMVCV